MAPLCAVDSMPDLSTQVIAVLGLGFLAAAIASGLLRRRTLTELGALFAGLGMVAGPLGLDLLPALGTGVGDLVVAALAGWVALEVGLGISMRTDGGLAPGAMRAGVLYTLVGVIGLGIVSFGVLEALLTHTLDTTWAYPSLVIAVASVAAAPGALAGVATAHGADGPVRTAGTSLARVARFLAIVAVALVSTMTEPEMVVAGFRTLAPAERVLGEVVLGVIFGFFADVFIADEPDDRRLVTILIGLSLLATGLCAHLGLSPMLVNLLMGCSLANYGHLSSTRHRTAEALEGPTRKVLLVLMGAAWLPPSDPMIWAVVALMLGARVAMLRIAGGVAGRAFDPSHAGFRIIGFTMVAQGAPALAIALIYTPSPQTVAGGVVLTVVLLSAMVNDLWAPVAARLVLDEAGEIPTTVVEA
ncbi:MAG: hypothetical protein QF464_09325 [Myxococcota bacterium]|nr:hypothetical protein [Myxococcota bacterium]